jgi:hypothetical protein
MSQHANDLFILFALVVSFGFGNMSSTATAPSQLNRPMLVVVIVVLLMAK